MVIKNERLIIKEEDLEKDLDKLKNRIDNIFKELGFDKECTVEYLPDCCNDSITWKEINIQSGDFWLQYETEDMVPTLVKDGNDFEFYWVFERSASGSTNPHTWINTGHSPMDNRMVTVEDLVLDLLNGGNLL